MKRRMVKQLLPAIALLISGPALAANILVWNYDPEDKFYDQTVGDSIDCAWWVERDLQALGHNVTLSNYDLPADLAPYDAVFCLMGWYRC